MRAIFANNEIYKPLLLKSQAQGVRVAIRVARCLL